MLTEGSTDYPPTTLVGERLVESLDPLMTTQLAWVMDAIGVMFEQTAQMTYDRGIDDAVDFVHGSGYVVEPYVPGYGSLFDPATSTQLPYLGQFVGVSVPDGTASATAISMISEEAGMSRGTDSAMIAAAKRNLTGTQFVSFLPRQRPDGVLDAYWFLIFVRPGECPNPTAVVNAVNAVKPAGLLWSLILADGYTWAQTTRTWGAEGTTTWQQTATVQP